MIKAYKMDYNEFGPIYTDAEVKPTGRYKFKKVLKTEDTEPREYLFIEVKGFLWFKKWLREDDIYFKDETEEVFTCSNK